MTAPTDKTCATHHGARMLGDDCELAVNTGPHTRGECTPVVTAPASGTDPRAIVAEQARDEGLWFVAQTAAEGYLQQELRRLHAAVGGEPVPAPGTEQAETRPERYCANPHHIRDSGRDAPSLTFSDEDCFYRDTDEPGFECVPAVLVPVETWEAVTALIAEWDAEACRRVAKMGPERSSYLSARYEGVAETLESCVGALRAALTAVQGGTDTPQEGSDGPV